MSSLLAGRAKPVSAPTHETEVARLAGSALSKFIEGDLESVIVHLQKVHSGDEIELTIPAVAICVLIDVLANMAEGRPVSLVPIDSELSTQQAADMLNVSRPFFIKLLEQGKMPYRKVGEQRRVRFQDLLRYIAEYQKAAYKGLEELTAEAQGMGLYE